MFEKFVEWKNSVKISWPIVVFISLCLSMLVTALVVNFATAVPVQIGFLVGFGFLSYRLIRKEFPGAEAVKKP